MCLNVYYALFYSHLTYGINVWALTSNDNLNKIEILQNKCVRILTHSDFDAHANPLYLNLQLLKVHDIIMLNHIIFTYQFTKNCLPTDIQGLFSFSRDIVTSNMNLGSIRKNHLIIPRINNDFSGTKSLRYKCPSIWNNFMNDISSKKILLSANPNDNLDLDKINNVHQLKRKLKLHFLHKYLLS